MERTRSIETAGSSTVCGEAMHALILVLPGGEHPPDTETQKEHERFIDSLNEANKVVLGGSWTPTVGGFTCAYLVSCTSLDEAHEIARSDPLFRTAAFRYDVVEWQLISLNPDAVDRSSLLYP